MRGRLLSPTRSQQKSFGETAKRPTEITTTQRSQIEIAVVISPSSDSDSARWFGSAVGIRLPDVADPRLMTNQNRMCNSQCRLSGNIIP